MWVLLSILCFVALIVILCIPSGPECPECGSHATVEAYTGKGCYNCHHIWDEPKEKIDE